MLLHLQKILLLITVLALSACASFVPKEHVVPKEKLSSALQSKFPLRYDGGGLLSVAIDSPQLSMLPEQNRVSVQAHYIANAAMLELRGDFVFSSRFSYDPESQAIFLNEVHVDSSLSGGNFFEANLINFLNMNLNEFVNKNPVYVFRPEELVVLGVKMDVSVIEVVNEGILLRLRKRADVQN
jgi:hypothetical protein